MRVAAVETKLIPCTLVITVKSPDPIILRVTGKDPKRPNSKYFSRGLGNEKEPWKGITKLCFPMPLTPELLHVEVKAMGQLNDNIEILSLELKPLVQRKPKLKIRNAPMPVNADDFLWLQKDEYEFFKFALQFARSAGFMDEGAYDSDNEMYSIVYVDQIRDTKTGKLESTPARISRKNGIIEISRSKFQHFTIPMRVIILLHEFMHWRLKTRIELECDFNAINVFLKYGFSKTEAMYAFTKVFKGETRLEGRTSQIVDFIEKFEDLNCK